MPAIWNVIRTEHGEVNELFTQFSTADTTQQQSIFNNIKQALTAHAELEEELVYPLLRDMDNEMAQHAQEEHAEVKMLLSELSALEIGGEEFMRKMERLQTAVNEHVTEEEDEVLPMMEGAVEDSEAQQIGSEWARQKKELIAAG